MFALALAAFALWQFHLREARVGGLLANTLWLIGGSCAIALPLGTLLAVLLCRTDLPGRRGFLWALAGMLLVPLYLDGAAWLAGFGDLGWWTTASEGPAYLRGWPAAIWVHGLAAVPLVALIVGAATMLVESELEEQALVDGGAGRVLATVTLRRVLPAIVVAAAWIAITCTSEISVTDLFQVRTLAEEAYTQAALGEGSIGAVPPGIILGPWFGLLMLVLAIAVAHTQAGVRWAGQRQLVFQLGRARWLWWFAVVLAFGILVAVPVGSLLWKAGVHVSPAGSELERHWSAVKCLKTIAQSPWRYRSEFCWSIASAGCAATLATTCGIAIGCAARRPSWRSSVLLAGVGASALVPGPVLGLAVIDLLDRPGWSGLAWLYDRTLLAPCLVQAARALPLAALVAWCALRAVPRELLELAELEGAGPLRLITRVALPICRPALAAAWLVAFAVALGELSASILVTPPGVNLLSIRVFGLIHFGVEDQVAGICLTLVGAVSLASWAAAACLRRQFRRNQPLAPSTRSPASVAS